MSYGNVSVDNLTSSTGGVISPNITSLRNRIINGAMGIWQRGTSGFTTNSTYAADRWFVYTNGSLSTGAQSTDVPTGFKYSFSLAGSNYPQICQRIESLNCTDLGGQSVTVSFWAKQTSGAGSGSIGLNLSYVNSTDNWAGGQTSIGTNTFTGTSSWTYYSYTFSSISSNAVNGLSVLLYGNTSSSAAILFTGVQLEAGTQATSFDYRHYGQELVFCQRYYEVASISSCWFFPNIYDNPSYRMCPDFSWHTTKRANPTVVVNGGATAYNNAGGAFAISSYTTSYASVDTYGISCTKSGGNWSTSEPISLINITVTASSEL